MADDKAEGLFDEVVTEREAGYGEAVYADLWLSELHEEQVDYILARRREYLKWTTPLERELWRAAATELWQDASRGDVSPMLRRVTEQFDRLSDGMTRESWEGYEVWVLAHGLAMLQGWLVHKERFAH